MLDPFFIPKSIAVIGASSNSRKLGYAVLKNLVDGGYAENHSVYPINPRADKILELPVFPTVSSVPGSID
ncbi:MAG: CoA-binding protein, partial [Chloroflexota bacterium]|nr:CoA-binding protein [Chloroflexota bacterium]